MKGVNAHVVGQISSSKSEPEWMEQLRFRSLRLFDERLMAEWFVADLCEIDFQDIDSEPQSEDVLSDLTGKTALLGSEAASEEHREALEQQGVLFCDMDTAIRKHPRLVQEYFGTVISPGADNFADLNTSIWAGGAFVYVPSGIEVAIPLQSDLPTHFETGGQFQRTLIIAEEGSKVRYIEGCSAPVYTKNTLRCAVVEIVVKPNAWVSYTAMQNWSHNVDNFVMNRARVEAGGHVEFVDIDIGSKRTAKYPAIHLVGDGASGEVRSVSYAGRGQHQETEAKMVHAAPNTSSKVVSKSISQQSGTTPYRCLVRVDEDATQAASVLSCEALLLDEQSVSLTPPDLKIAEEDARITHDANVSKIDDVQLFYLMSRGLSAEQAMGLIVNGFIEPVTQTLPMEYAVEWNRLIELQMAGSVG